MNGDEPSISNRPEENDRDLQRAKDLLQLHSTVQLVQPDGTDKDLNEAREAVSTVLRSLS